VHFDCIFSLSLFYSLHLTFGQVHRQRRIFSICNTPHGNNRAGMYNFFMSMKHSSGGFRMHSDGEVDTRGTYTVLAISRILNILTPGAVIFICFVYLVSGIICRLAISISMKQTAVYYYWRLWLLLFQFDVCLLLSFPLRRIMITI
jgi:hypothetical protein